MNYNFGGGGGLGGAGAGGFQTGGFQQKQQQPTFGAPTSTFSFGKTPTPTSGFNTPQQAGAFNLGGQTAASGLGAFGQQQIGGFAAPQTAFGAAKFGTGASGGLGGLGGKTSPSSFGGFGGGATQQTQAFGGASAFGAGGFGAPQQQQQMGGGMFGAQTNGALAFGQQQAVGGMNLGGGFGQQPQQGTGNPPFEPAKIDETVLDKNRVQKRETFYLQVISGQAAYESKSQEELRFEDYRKGLRGPTAGAGLGAFQLGGAMTGGGFVSPPSSASPFGQPAATGFGMGAFTQPAQSSTTSAFCAGGGMFGTAAPAGGMFGQQPAQSQFGQQQPATSFSFGQPAAQPATGGMFGAPAATSAFGAAPAFGATPAAFGAPAATSAFGAAPAFGQQPAATGFGGFGNMAGFGQPAAAATTGFGAPAAAAAPAYSGFGAPAAASTGGAFGGGAGGAFSFGQPAAQPAAGGMFGAPAATSAFGAAPAFGATPAAFGAPAATSAFGAAPAFGQQPAATGFGGFGNMAGFGQPAAAATTGFGAPAAAAAPAFSGFGAPAAASTGGMFGSLGGFGAATTPSPAFGGFGGFGSTAAAKPAVGNFSLAPNPAQSWGAFGAAAQAPQTMFSQGGVGAAPGAAPLLSTQETVYPTYEYKMELLKSKRDELDVQLKDARIYGSAGADPASIYNTTTFSVPRRLAIYKQTSRSTAKIVPRGIVTSATMSTLQRPLSSVLSAATNGGATADMMSPEKLLGRSAKRLIISSVGFNNLDPTIDLPLPSYQQKQQAVRFLQNEPSDGTSPPRALLLDSSAGVSRITDGGGDVTGLTPSATRSPYTPNAGGGGEELVHTPTSGSSTGTALVMQDRPLKATAQRMTTPYNSRVGERERESLDRSTTDVDSSLAFGASNPPTLERPGYLTTPSMAVLRKMSDKDLSRVRNFSIYRPNIGKIEWEGETDVRGLDLDSIVNIEKRGVDVYDSDKAALVKPPVGQGLNKTALIILGNIFPQEGSSDLKKSQFSEKLIKICEKSDSEFIDYDAVTGEWIFRVEHFSRYGLDDSDDEEEPPVTKPAALPPRKSPIVLGTEPQVVGVAPPVEAETAATSAMPEQAPDTQYVKYSLKPTGSDPADLSRMRLSFSQPTHGQGPLKSGIFSPRGFSAVAAPTPTVPTPVSVSAVRVQAPAPAPMAVNASPSPAVIPKNEVSEETKAAIREAQLHPYHNTSESPCMQILLQVKKDYLAVMGQASVSAKPVITKVGGTGAPVSRVLQKRSQDASLSMGRSFRVGWGPNGEMVHSGMLLFGAADPTYGRSQRIVIQKVDTVRWIEERIAEDSPSMMSDAEAGSVTDRCEDTLKAVLQHSFVFDGVADALREADLESSPEDEFLSSDPTHDTVPMWRAPYAKPWELQEYVPYLNTLEALMKIFTDRKVAVSNSDWAVGKAVELVAAVSGQEEGSYTVAKELYSTVGGGDKLGVGSYGKGKEIALIAHLNSCRPSLDMMPLYEERDDHPPVDWERRREAISAWLINITTVEVVEDADEVDAGSCGQSPETYHRLFQLLSCNRLLDAVELAESAGLYRMATLLSQIGDDSAFVELIGLQLEQWADNEGCPETNTIPQGILDLYRLMGSDPFPSDSWPGESILKNIGWARALAMLFWYCDTLSSPDGSIGKLTDSLALYDEALARGFVDQPTSPYIADRDVFGLNVQYPETQHGLYSLLQVFFRHPDLRDEEMTGKIVTALRCEGYTRDPLDYRGVYLVLQLLECMGVASSDSVYSSLVRNHFISQLISEGCWLWAVFIALQIPDDAQRSFIVKEMILRYAVIEGDVTLVEEAKKAGLERRRSGEHDMSALDSLRNNTSTVDQVHFLVNILRVPIALVHEAAAHRCGYSHNYIKQVQHLNFAQLWTQAKEIVCTKLAPMIWTKSSSASISLLNLLESMDADVSDLEDVWSSRSNILLTFLRLKAHVDKLVKAPMGAYYGMDGSRSEDYEMSMIAEDLQETVVEARLLLERVQMLNSTACTLLSSGMKRSKGPSLEHATLLNIGSYLFDFIDRVSWRNDYNHRFENPDSDLYESVHLFENGLSNSFPVLGNHVLRSMHQHSAAMLKEASYRLSMSYKLSINAVEMNVE